MTTLTIRFNNQEEYDAVKKAAKAADRSMNKYITRAAVKEVITGINQSKISECSNGKCEYAGGYIWEQVSS